MESATFTHENDFHDIVNDNELLRTCTEKFLSSIIDDITLGIIFDIHRKAKTNSFDLDTAPVSEEELAARATFFEQNNLKKTLECECPNCNATVAAKTFASHLEGCMGLGRSRSRNASRRIANNNNNNNNNSSSNNKDRDSTPYTGLPSDDEDDDWNSEDKRRKRKSRNGTKKGKGTPKKTPSETSESVESVNVDIEGDEDGEINLRDMMHDSSNNSSPGEMSSGSSNNNNHSSSRRKEKTKSRKSLKNGPSSSIAE